MKTSWISGPVKAARQWTLGMHLGVLGHYFTCFGGLGISLTRLYFLVSTVLANACLAAGATICAKYPCLQ